MLHDGMGRCATSGNAKRARGPAATQHAYIATMRKQLACHDISPPSPRTASGRWVPADAGEVRKLASAYASPALGIFRVRVEDGTTIFDFGKWHGAVASRKNDDGTISLISIDPTVDGFQISWSANETEKAR